MNKEKKITEAMNEFKNKIDKIFVGKTPKLTGAEDLLYECDIYLFRHRGMGSSKQIICASNVLSIKTITASYLGTLVKQGIVNIEELDEIVECAKETLKKTARSDIDA